MTRGNKNIRILISTTLHFKKKIKENTWQYHYFTPAYQTFWYDVQFLRQGVWQTGLGTFEWLLPIHPPNPPSPPPKKNKTQKFEKNERNCRYQCYVCVPKVTITWCTVPELRSEMDIIFCHFRPFLPFYPLNNPGNQDFKIWKKAPGDVIILHLCTKNQDHVIYASWDMECDRQNYLSFWAIFCPFTPLTTRNYPWQS